MTMTEEVPAVEWVAEKPTRIRRGPSSREWEKILLPTLEANPDTTFRIYTFDKRQKAVNRNQHIRNRLKAVRPDVVVKCEVAEYAPGSFGSYITLVSGGEGGSAPS